MTNPAESLVDLLDLEQIEVNIFRGRSPHESLQRVFGGQVAGQALVAAARTTDGKRQPECPIRNRCTRLFPQFRTPAGPVPSPPAPAPPSRAGARKCMKKLLLRMRRGPQSCTRYAVCGP